ncbi:hypothetical protein DM813_03145 [Pseudomonas alkylphenolica]|uniref:Uncharacterized protein n=1 Tax=Pseudomonas alkylphenolica TaxID=237609 RepID=A0A444A0M4_9PSED|nr:hypothetical protein [Pseudomonas alkylphenolica]RWU26842.1 hypothetical protein DM813_03145 [Pseudomonas alkylphenolica]
MTALRPLGILLALLFTLYLPSATAARSLVVWVYAHDDLADISDAQLNKDYFQHWIDEMRLITNHPIEVIFERNVPGITDITYSSMSAASLLAMFSNQSSDIDHQRERSPSYLNKSILLTKEPYDKSESGLLAGLAYVKQTTAIASLATFVAPAHELGHLFSATHNDAEVNFNGWFCETYTFETRLSLRSNCYRYSDKNRQNIADYINYYSS